MLSSNLAGNDYAPVVTSSQFIYGIAIDYVGKKLYYVDYVLETLSRVNYDGQCPANEAALIITFSPYDLYHKYLSATINKKR